MKITKRVFAIFLFIVVCFSMVNCATVFSGTSQTVAVNSDPQGADVKINGIMRGQTPLSLKLNKKQAPYYVTISKDGYKDAYYTITNKPGVGWIVLDVVTGLFELAVDAITGAYYEITPKSINAHLEPSNN